MLCYNLFHLRGLNLDIIVLGCYIIGYFGVIIDHKGLNWCWIDLIWFPREVKLVFVLVHKVFDRIPVGFLRVITVSHYNLDDQ